MEGLIFALIAMAVGAFLNNKKKDDPETTNSPKQSRSMPAGRGKQTFKRVEDYAKDVYGDFQAQMKENPQRAKKLTEQTGKMAERLPARERERAMQTVERGRQAVERLPQMNAKRPPQPQMPSIGRLSAHQDTELLRSREDREAESSFSLEAEDLKKAIIFAEILLPPKSKR